MRLLPKTSLAPSKPTLEQQTSQKIVALQGRLLEISLDVESADSQAEKKKAQIQQELGEFVARTTGIRTALKAEVETLERRKMTALMPLMDRERQIETQESFLSQRETVVRAVEEAQQAKTQELSERELSIVAQEQKVTARDEHSAMLLAEAQKTSKAAREQAHWVALDVQKWEQDKQQAQAEIDSQSALLVAAQEVIAKDREQLNEREANLVKQAQSLGVREQTLAQAFTEARKKNLL